MTPTKQEGTQVPNNTQQLIEEAVERIKEENETTLDIIPEQFCSMCEKYGDWIVPNDEPESKEKYPWFCTNCEDASEIINLREQFIDNIREELTAIASKSAEMEREQGLKDALVLAYDLANKNGSLDYGKLHRKIEGAISQKESL